MVDRQDTAPVCTCIMCGDEIYPGEIVWDADEGPLHMDRVCVREYIDEHYLYSGDGAADLMSLLRIPSHTA